MKYLILFFIFTFNSFANDPKEIIEEFKRQRAQMMKQMMDMFNDDFSNDFFSDDFDPFKGKSKFRSSQGSVVDIQEEYKENGDLHIKIIPKSQNVKFDIKTSENSITIKSESQNESTTDKKVGKFKSYSSSSFSRTIQIPYGYKVGETKAMDKGFKIILHPREKIKRYKKNIDKTPIKRDEVEEII